MRKHSALILLTVCAPLVFAALIADLEPLRWLAAMAVPAVPVLLIVVARGDRCRSIGGLLLLWLLLAGSWLGLMWLSASRDLSHASVGEVAATLGLMLLGLGLGPLLLVAWLYARDFSSQGLERRDLERLREGRES